MKRIGDHTWEVTQSTPIQIGKPASRPSSEALEAMRQAVSSTGATTVYWFWVSIGGDQPHLGLAVAPAADEVVTRVGCAVEPLWKKYSPSNSVFDVLRMGDPKIDPLIIEHGELLHTAVTRR